MRTKLTQSFLFALLLLASYLASAQTPPACPSTNTPAADFCPDMCIYCGLEGYTGSTVGYTGQTPVGGFCGGGSSIENEQWIGFVAGTTTATISATPSNCTDGNGIQIALYTDCTSAPLQNGCDMGFNGGASYSPSIAVSLTPGTIYYLLVDGWAGDQCDFTLSVFPPGAALNGQIIAEDVPLCPSQIFSYEGIEYTAPGVVLDTLSSIGACDTILLFNLVEAPLNNISQTIQFCPGESVVINGVTFTEPGSYIYNITATAGGCDTVVTSILEWLPQPVRSETLLLQPGESVSIGGNDYFAPDTVTSYVPAAMGCDTAVTYILLLDQSILDTCLVTEGFLKKMGEQGIFETGNVICAAADGNLYIAGEKGEESLLMKVTSDGAVLWSRSFRPDPSLAMHVTDLIEDSEGMLAGCGIVGEGDINLKSYAFRYNPLTDNFIWSKMLQQQSPEAFSILEKSPGDNFLLLTSPQLALNVDDAEIWELNRNTGALVGSLTDRYNFGISDVFTSMVIHDGAIYTTGRHIPTFGPIPPLGKMRMGLSKLDLATGNPVWSRLSHLDTSVVASLRGEDLLIDDSAVLTVYSGSDTTGASQVFFLQKTSLDGELLWVKRYSTPGQPYSNAHDILQMSDGYILVGSVGLFSGDTNTIFVKTDFDGNVQWANGVASSAVANAGSRRHSAVILNDVLLFAGVTNDAPGDILFLKMTADGEAGDSCAYIEPLNLQMSPVPDPVNMPIQLTLGQNIGQLANTTQDISPANMPVTTYCVGCLLNCDDTLDLGPDIILCKDSIVTFNASGNFVSYLWQDGSTDSTFTATESNIYWVEVTNECGDKQRDSVLLGISLAGDIKLADTTICAGGSVTVTVTDFDTYLWSPTTGLSCDTCATVTFQPNMTTVYALFAENTAGCTKIDTFTLTVLPLEIRSELVEFCPGESVTIGGNIYSQPGTVVDTISASVGCDTIVTYTLILLPQPTLSKLVEFCSGESVTIGGNIYSQPGTVVDTVAAMVGCDTIVTYILQFITTPNSSVSIDCAEDINITNTPGTGPVVVNYDLPTVSSDCDCPGISLTLTEGLASGVMFPVGSTQVCYEAKDSCGNTAACCFNVTVGEERPCDTKVVGCMKWELLSITKDAQGKRTYRIRVTNLCSNKLVYTAFQLPNGIVATSPPNNSVYAAPSGREYGVRNPNFSPFYSIRFKSNDDGIASGQSDIFEYTLPPQAAPAYIHVTARIEPKTFYSSHLTTILCPVGVTPNSRPDLDVRQQFDFENSGNLTNLRVFPNPTSGLLFTDLSDWEGEQLQVQIFNSQGQRVLQNTVQASDAAQEIQLPEGLAAGLYFLDVLTEKGEKQSVRFVVQR